MTDRRRPNHRRIKNEIFVPSSEALKLFWISPYGLSSFGLLHWPTYLAVIIVVAVTIFDEP